MLTSFFLIPDHYVTEKKKGSHFMNKNRSATVQQNILYFKARRRQMLTKTPPLLQPCSDTIFANCIYKHEQKAGPLCKHRQHQKKLHLPTQPEGPQNRAGAAESRSCLAGLPQKPQRSAALSSPLLTLSFHFLSFS